VNPLPGTNDKNLPEEYGTYCQEEQKFFFTLCRIPLQPFVVIVKPGNLPA
jgi:hypothetical protein